ncbi:hypothetical protein [Nocardioides ultimimeridianus]
MIDPRDPLAGLDPYPRDLIDTLGLHPEHADLLEDIVSTPGPTPTAARTRVLLAIGIAAAVAIIGGGWLLASTNGDGDSTPVAAASATTSPASTATSTPSATGTATPGNGRDGQSCRHFLSRHGQVRDALQRLQSGVLGKKVKGERLYLRVDKRGRQVVVVVGPGCRVRGLRSLDAIKRH